MLACAIAPGCTFFQDVGTDVTNTFGKHEIEVDSDLRERAMERVSHPLPDMHFGPSEVSVISPAVATQLFEYRALPVDILPVIKANISAKGVITTVDPYRYAVTDVAVSMNVISTLLTKMGCTVESTAPGAGVQTVVFVEPSMGKALALVRSLLGTSGRISQAPGGWVSVSDSAENLQKISRILQDAGFLPGELVRQKDLSMNVYTCRNRTAADLMNAIQPHISPAGSLQEVPPDKIVICDSSERIEMLHKILEEIDSLQPLVVIESKIYEIFDDTTADYSSYIVWREKLAHQDMAVSIEQNLVSARSTAANAVGTLLRATRQGRGDLNMGEVSAFLDFLVSEGKARVVTEPWITVISGEKASISTGDEIPYRAYQVVGGSESFVTAYQTAETKLEVTPRVLSGGLIEMKISPEVDSIAGYRGAEQLPVISKRRADTKVIIASGDTHVIGGLRKEEQRSVNRGLPGLRHIPLIGLLFRSNDFEVNHTELFIAIKPYVVMPGSQEARRAEAKSKAGQPGMGAPISKTTSGH